jgi:hypothetical protein
MMGKRINDASEASRGNPAKAAILLIMPSSRPRCVGYT